MPKPLLRLLTCLLLLTATACGGPADGGAAGGASATRGAADGAGAAHGAAGGAGAARGEMTASGPRGLFFMTRYWSGGSLELAATYFARDGKVYENPEGVDAEALAGHRGRQGTFEVQGEEMTVTWADGQVTESTVERDGGGGAFMWDMGIFSPVEPFAGGKEIAGSYEGGHSLSRGGSHVAVSKTLELRPDGTFTWTGIGAVDAGRASAGAQTESGGTWSASGYTLTLKGGDGNVLRGIAFPYDDEETQMKPDRLYFAGTMYEKKG